MTTKSILYKAGYKYQLHADYAVDLGIGKEIETEYISIRGGVLRIRAGYAWDGPSGPAIDTKNFMRGSLVHDALYQLMRQGYLDADHWREYADELLRKMCMEDGMSHIRAELVYAAVRKFAGPAAERDNAKRVIEAP